MAVVSEIKSRWRSGDMPDTSVVLGKYPELRHQKTAIVNLAFEEYTLRRAAGEAVEVDEFCRRFPSFQRSLHRRIQVDEVFSIQAEMDQADAAKIDWPSSEHDFLEFHLLEMLGEGAVGRVYLASQIDLSNRLVVIKLAPNADREAKTLGRLNHPNVVPIHCIEEDVDSGLSGIIMPFTSRTTLCDLLDTAFESTRGPGRLRPVLAALHRSLPREELETYDLKSDSFIERATWADGVLRIGQQLADALTHAHSRGVLHLDLKPSNVLIRPDGVALLIDFNLSADEAVDTRVVGGTLPYMSPEQMATTLLEEGDPAQIDGRSDVYSLAVMLVESLTGEHPFAPFKSGPIDVMAESLLQRQQATDISGRLRVLDAPTRDIILRCLHRDPSQRPYAAELATELKRSLKKPSCFRRWSKTRRGFLTLSVAAISAGVVAGDLAIETPAEVLAEANAFLAAEDYVGAFARFERLLKMTGDSKWEMGMGYCRAQDGAHAHAAFHYDLAAKAIHDNPLLLNAMAASAWHIHPDKQRCRELMDQALARPNQHAVLLVNRAILSCVTPGTPSTRKLNDVEAALATGESSPDLCFLAATVLDRAPAKRRDPQRILRLLERAFKLGIDPARLKQLLASAPPGYWFKELHEDARFQALIGKPDFSGDGPVGFQFLLVNPLDA